MGPTNIALVKLYKADMALREAQSRLDAATKNVRIQERRTNDLQAKMEAAQARLKQGQARSANLELDLKTRDEHIEKLRTQQQNARNNKEYQSFLVEINTQKLDRNKVEEQTMKALEEVERTSAELQSLSAQRDAEGTRLQTMKGEIGEQIAALQAEVDSLRPARDEAAEQVPPRATNMFERLSERFEGEALAALDRTHPKREEYVCTACNMDLVTDVYNRLHTRDELITCPSCGRLLYIPEDLTTEKAVNKKKEVKPRRSRKTPPAAIGRQSSAVDVLNSMRPDADDEETATEAPDSTTPDAAPLDETAQQPQESSSQA